MKNLKNESINEVNICGKLVSVNVREGVMKNGKPYASGRAVVRVNQSYLGKTETSDISVSIFSGKFTSRGSNNPSYDNIMSMKNLKTVEEYGLVEADTVCFRDSSTYLRENTFVSKNTNSLIDTWEINSRFINTTRGANDFAGFNVEMVILDMFDEIDSEGEPTGRLVIKGAVVKYGEAIDVFDFYVDDPASAAQVQRLYDINSTIRAYGRIRMSAKEVKKSVSASAWGEEPPQRTTTRTVKELILTGGDVVENEDLQYDIAEIKKAWNQRKANREQMRQDSESTVKAPAKVARTKYDWEED